MGLNCSGSKRVDISAGMGWMADTRTLSLKNFLLTARFNLLRVEARPERHFLWSFHLSYSVSSRHKNLRLYPYMPFISFIMCYLFPSLKSVCIYNVDHCGHENPICFPGLFLPSFILQSYTGEVCTQPSSYASSAG
jgi:hypothetical protein